MPPGLRSFPLQRAPPPPEAARFQDTMSAGQRNRSRGRKSLIFSPAAPVSGFFRLFFPGRGAT